MTISNVTFRGSRGIAVTAPSGGTTGGGTHSLRNVLFENIQGTYSNAGGPGSAVNSQSGSVFTLHNTVIRDTLIGNAAITTASNGTVTLKGCLTTQRIFPQLLHSGKSGSITNNSTGACSGTIGNGDQAVRRISPPAVAACGLPKQGFLGTNAVYNLRGNCQQTGRLYIPKGVSITINGNGYTIRGGSFTSFLTAGILTIRGTVISGSAARPLFTYLKEGRLLVEHSTFRNNGNSMVVADNTATFNKVIFENNRTTSTGFAASTLISYLTATVNINNSIFRNNSGGSGAIHTHGDVRLFNTTFAGNSPKDIHDPSSKLTRLTTGTDDGSTPGAPPPPKPKPAPAAAEESRSAGPPASTYENIPVGVARLFRSGNGADTVIDVYGVDANSNGFYILSVTQRQVEAALAAGRTMVAVSADGRLLVLVTAAGNVTIQVGPNAEGKILHTTFAGGLFGPIIGTTSPYGDAPGLPYLSAAAAQQTSSVQNCMVTTTHGLNLRASAGGNIIGGVPNNATLTVLARSPGWFQVDYHGVAGWISASYAVPQGDCG